MSVPIEQIEAAVAEHGSMRAAAAALGMNESTVRRRLKRAGKSTPAPSGQTPGPEKVGVTVDHEKGEATITGPPSAAVGGTVEELIRENGLDPEEWIVASTTLNKYNALGARDPETGKNPVIVMRQVKVTLRRRPEAFFPRAVTPAESFKLRKAPRVRRDSNRPRLAIVEFDHQAPYHDPALDAAATAMHADLQPDEQVFGGDLMDFPTISRHPDHPAAMAGAQECLVAGHGILVRRREAAPNARARKLKGNHDWRPEWELLTRAERMYGLRPVGEDIPALSLRGLLHLDALGVELVEHPLGWEHAEVELVPGTAGLVVRHGWLTGANTAGRSLAKRGRSLIVGHTHTREHVFQWDPSAELERQAAVAGTMSRVRGEAFEARLRTAAGLSGDVDNLFPHFAVLDNWLQGLVTVTTWPDGCFLIEHARWENGALHWRDRRWTA